MITISCDVCKKKLDESNYGRTFFFYANHSICETCKDNLEFSAKSQVRARTPFSMDWYSKFMRDSLDKAVQKGRI
ncbi:MAG: hypothetical protein FWD40_00220 [Treponema sp.]|nr:hypothetical protein [Treponema sp.]